MLFAVIVILVALQSFFLVHLVYCIGLISLIGKGFFLLNYTLMQQFSAFFLMAYQQGTETVKVHVQLFDH